MNYGRKRFTILPEDARILTKDEMNLLLTKSKDRTRFPFKPDEDYVITNEIFYWQSKGKNLYLFGRGLTDSKLHMYVHWLDDRERVKMQTPFRAASWFYRCQEVHNLVKEDTKWEDLTVSPLRIEADQGIYPSTFTYDLNKAYLFAMMNTPMPDTEHMKMQTHVGCGELGFRMGETIHSPKHGPRTRIYQVDEGQYADFVFPKMEFNLYANFAQKIADKLNSTDDQAERKKLKDTYVFSVGLLQKRNPFHRAAIVEACNRYMRKLIDENTIAINTDAIISTKKRFDLDIGNGIGQFKLEEKKCGKMERTSNAYIWDCSSVYYGPNVEENTRFFDEERFLICDKF